MLYVGSDNLVWLLGLINNNANPPAYVNNATVTVTITDQLGNAVGSPFNLTASGSAVSVTVTLPNGNTITSPDGNYSGVLTYTTPLVEGTTYFLTAVATAASGYRTFKGSFTAGYSLT